MFPTDSYPVVISLFYYVLLLYLGLFSCYKDTVFINSSDDEKVLKTGQVYPEGGEHQEETNEDECDDELPDPFEPGAVRDARHTQDTDEHSAGGCEHVGEAVAELEGQDGGLARDIDEIGELGHDGHGEGCFGRAAGHNDIEQRLEEVHHAEGGHFAGLCQ